MRITEHDTLDGLIADMKAIPVKAKAEMREIVRDGARAGNELAKDFARRSSGTHARKYPGTFSSEVLSGRGLFGNVYSAEYGPRVGGQGSLAPILENGSRNNPPHLNLARSADIIGPSFAQEVRQRMDGWFW